MILREWDKSAPLKEGTIILYDGKVRRIIREFHKFYLLSDTIETIKRNDYRLTWKFFADNADVNIIREPFPFESDYENHRYSLVILYMLYEMFDLRIRAPILNFVRFISSKQEKKAWYSRMHYKVSVAIWPLRVAIKRIKDRIHGHDVTKSSRKIRGDKLWWIL